MKRYILSFIILLMICILLSDYSPEKILNRDNEVKKRIEQHLSLYPINKIEDFYEMEGYRDADFENDDKGMWILHDHIAHQSSDSAPLDVEGVVLYIYKNKREITGHYYTDHYYEEATGDNEKKYPLTVKNNQLVLAKSAPEKVKEKVKTFRFLIQDEKMNQLTNNEEIKTTFNPELHTYQAEYLLERFNNINRWIQRQYDTAPKGATIALDGGGDKNGSKISELNFEVNYYHDKERILSFSESVLYQPTSDL